MIGNINSDILEILIYTLFALHPILPFKWRNERMKNDGNFISFPHMISFLHL